MSKETLFILDSLRCDLSRAVRAVSVIQAAMAAGAIPGKEDAPDALYCVWERLYDISEKISQQVDAEYKQRRAEA